MIKNFIGNFKRKQFLLFSLGFALLYSFYILDSYQLRNPKIDTIEIQINVQVYEPVIYSRSTGNTDFDKPIHAALSNGRFVYDLSSHTTRNFRLYIGTAIDTGIIRNIAFINQNQTENISLNEFKVSNLRFKNLNDSTGFFSCDRTGYIELKRNNINYIEGVFILIFGIIGSFLSALIGMFVFEHLLNHLLISFDLEVLSVSLFLSSFYLPFPITNILLIASSLIVISKFNFRILLENKIGLFLLIYFAWFVIHDVFFMTQFNSKLFETYLPFLILPIFFACIPSKNYLTLFPAAAVFYCNYYLITSIFDYVIYKNLSAFSFDGFTKNVHPIYFSYNIVFSMFVLWLYPIQNKYKHILSLLLLISLFCCGSKLMIALVVLLFTFQLVKTSLFKGFVFGIGVIFVLLIFEPTRQRFVEILDVKSLTVLSENPIKTRFDSRINGLTLRLIIWQEAIKSASGFKQFLIGIGTDDVADKNLEQKLTSRGLEPNHVKYDPHNQFITSFYKFGIIGVIVLVSFCMYCFYLASKFSNSLLFYTSILFLVAMFAESLWQRYIGIYFFGSIFLILSTFVKQLNSTHENSHIRN